MGGWTSCLVAEDTQIRVVRQLQVSKGPNRIRQSDSLHKSLLTLCHGKMKMGDVEVDEGDDG
jgi:hypothetical protein